MKVRTGLREAICLIAGCCALIGLSACKDEPVVDPTPTGDLTGTVTDAVATSPLPDVSVVVEDSGGTVIASTTTNESGVYTVNVPLGVVKVRFEKPDFTSPEPLTVGALAGQAVTINVAMAQAASGKPTVTLSASGDGVGYGNTVALTATATDPQGDALTYEWVNNTSGMPKLGMIEGHSPTATLTMPSMKDAFARRENPTNPGEFIPGYTPENRFGILPIVPDTRSQLSAQVKVSDGRGDPTIASVTLNATSVQSGVRTVPVGARLYFNSGKDDNNAWTLTAQPSGSVAALADATTRFPSIIPDLAGKYTVTEGTNTLTFEAGKFVGVVTEVVDGHPKAGSACTVCHNGTMAMDVFTPWSKTGHASIFMEGINGGEGTSGSGCLDCHTVGHDRGANGNGGFDDVAAKEGWKFPAERTAGNFQSMIDEVPSLALRSNIQCENCHGPQDSANHMLTKQDTALRPFLSNRISFSAETCGTCHARTSHHIYSEWSTTSDSGMGHSNRTGALTVGARGGTLNGNCGRCHTAQGYTEYVKNLQQGISGALNTTNNPFMGDVTTANVEPVTCTACHDPHDATNPNQLRVFNDTGMLPAGFALTGMGKGALCATCHNSRNGAQTGSPTETYLHEDRELYNMGNPTGYSAPHQAAQTDVFAGRNAYFMGSALPMTSKHAAIEDTCVGCHMALQPQTRLSHGEPTRMNHLFRIADGDMGKLCAECHSTAVNGEATRAAVELGLETLAHKMGEAVMEKINHVPGGIINVRAYDETTDKYSHSTSLIAINVASNPVTHVGIVEGHGQIEFHLTLTNPVSIQLVDASNTPVGAPWVTNEFGVQMGSLKDNQASPKPLYALTGNMVRAGWNYFLIHSDNSKGLHNPTFAQQVINNTLGQDLSD